MTDLERQLIQDIHDKVYEIQNTLAVVIDRHNNQREQFDKVAEEVDLITKKVLKVEGAMWVLAGIFTFLGLIAKFIN